MQNRPKISAKVYLLICIVLTGNLGVFAQRPPTSGPNPEDKDNLIPYIIGGGGLVLGAGSYFYFKSRGPKIAVKEHLPSYLLSRNILPTPDAINLMHELNPRLSKKSIMRANKKLVNPEFPEIPQTLLTASAVQVTTSMPLALKEQMDGFISLLADYRSTEITIQPDNKKGTVQNFLSILERIEKDFTSTEGLSEISNTVKNELIIDLLKVLNQTLDKAISIKSLDEEDFVLVKEISENLSELLSPKINDEQNPNVVSRLHQFNSLEDELIFFASAEPKAPLYSFPSNSLKIPNEFKAADNTQEQDNNNMLKGFAIAVMKSNASGKSITKGPEVEGQYFVKYTSPALKDYPETYKNLSPPLASYASAYLPPSRLLFIIEDISGKPMELKEPVIDFRDAFSKPQQDKVKDLIVVPIYVITND